MEQTAMDPDIALKHPTYPWYLRVPFTSSNNSLKRKPDVEDGHPVITKEASATFFSLLTFGWMNPILSLGYTRPLEIEDLYTLQDHRSASHICNIILESFQSRCRIVDKYDSGLSDSDSIPSRWQLLLRTVLGNRSARVALWRTTSGTKKFALILALNDSVKWWFWSAGLLKIICDVLIITSPLLVQAIINFASDSYTTLSQGTKPPPIWKGIILAFALFLMQFIASICGHHYWYRATSTGVLLRGGLIAALHSHSFEHSPQARVSLPKSLLLTHIASDVSRIDSSAGLAHIAWTSFIQILIALIILLRNLGPSALAGFSLFLLGIPVQSWIVKQSYAARTNSLVFTEKRVNLIQELLSGIRVIKFFAWELPFLTVLSGFRKQELRYVRKLLLIRAGNNAVANSFPILATVLAFICYSQSGHSLNPGIIFSSLSLFQLLKTPVMLLRRSPKFLRIYSVANILDPFFILLDIGAAVSLSSITDAYNAISRLHHVFIADVAHDDRITNLDAEAGVNIAHASFTWESTSPPNHQSSDNNSKGNDAGVFSEKNVQHDLDNTVFRINDVNLIIPRGKLCAIVGPVGAGKSSLLQGIVGEMRKVEGTVTLGGSLSYCPQTSWIQNGTIRENICFGRPFDKERYWTAIHDSCLEQDLALLDYGDMTEIGEKGVSLSGGQKQRLNICRSIYARADVQIFDDPFSALDPLVGNNVFNNVFLSKGQKTTRVLVTHAVNLLPHADLIVTLVNGNITEHGTYDELIAKEGGAFAKFVRESDHKQTVEETDPVKDAETKPSNDSDITVNKESKASGKALMQAEERIVGSVSGSTYATYFAAGKGQIILPLILTSLVLIQGINVFSSYWLIYWEERKWPEAQAFYIGVYSGLGIAQAIISLLLGSLFAMQAYFSSRKLHHAAAERVMHAPTSFFETTPLGRIMNRFSKGKYRFSATVSTDSLDNFLGDAWAAVSNSLASIFGAVILISAVFPYFLIAVVILFTCYFYLTLFYRASARELNTEQVVLVVHLATGTYLLPSKDSILRSALVSHFSESLSGLTTIKAYGEFGRFQAELERRIDNENRAYWLKVASDRWLAIRLDTIGTFLILIVAMLSVLCRFIITPSQSGIMLSYILTVQSALSLVVRQGAAVEALMNNVERIVHYAEEVEQEKLKGEPDQQPPSSWPTTGRIEMNDLYLSYRPELPPSLKGLNISIAPGEKLAIVGRTGAGKSSIMAALYRLVEASSGSIAVDGVDISTLDLDVLRRSISIIPQETVLFPGTVRSNLDPFGQHDDALLWAALKSAHLVDQGADEDHALGSHAQSPVAADKKANRFALDVNIDSDGNNISMGERSLISLARALVKKSRILVLDEATASVDYETDRKVQDTVAHEFRDQTVLCIAHRLPTVIGYDRVCVMDAGQVAELDTPANLFEQQGIFRTLCDQSGISLDDILVAQKRA